MYNVLNKSACTVTSEKKWEDVLGLREIPWRKTWRPLFFVSFFQGAQNFVGFNILLFVEYMGQILSRRK